jgi:TRAP-type C4-dicarboxylate transport system substrate-binding protein
MKGAFNQTAKWYFDRVEKLTNGRFKIEYHVGQSLVPLKEQPEAVKAGICQSSIYVPNYMWGKLPLMDGLTYPFVLPGKGTRQGTLDVFKLTEMYYTHPEVTKELDRWDSMLIFPTAITQQHLIGNKPVRTVADLNGVKIRAVGPMGQLFKEFGAASVFVPLPEFYSSVQTGLVDLFCNDFYIFLIYKIIEVSKYAIDDMFMGAGMDPFVVKKSAFNALPKDIQKAMLEARKGAVEWVANFYHDYNSKARAECEKKLEMIHFPPEERAKMVKVAKETVWESWITKTEKRGLPARKMLEWIMGEAKKMGYAY